MAEKLEWMSKLRSCIEGKGGSSKESSVKSSKDSDSSVSTRPGSADGPTVSKADSILKTHFLVRNICSSLILISLLSKKSAFICIRIRLQF